MKRGQTRFTQGVSSPPAGAGATNLTPFTLNAWLPDARSRSAASRSAAGRPVAVQTMTKTETANLEATMDQIRRVAEAGADIVRVAVPRDRDVDALRTIVAESPIPVIADIHFNHTLALKSIDAGAHCVRINPGNIGGPEKVGEVVDRARAAGHAAAHRRQLGLAARAPARPRVHESRRGARARRDRDGRADAPARLLRLQGLDEVDVASRTRSRPTGCWPGRSTTRCTSGSPRPARSGPAP